MSVLFLVYSGFGNSQVGCWSMEVSKGFGRDKAFNPVQVLLMTSKLCVQVHIAFVIKELSAVWGSTQETGGSLLTD